MNQTVTLRATHSGAPLVSRLVPCVCQFCSNMCVTPVLACVCYYLPALDRAECQWPPLSDRLSRASSGALCAHIHTHPLLCLARRQHAERQVLCLGVLLGSQWT